MCKAWEGFTTGAWQSRIDVRDFIQKNYTPYGGDEAFLAPATPRTQALMHKLQGLMKLEQEFGGVLDVDTQTVSSLLIFGLNQILVTFSETATAVYGVYFKLQGFAFLPIIGMNNGMVPIIAYNYGARKPARIMQTIKLAIAYAVGIMVVAVVVFQIFPVQLLGVFQASEEMLAIGVPALRTLSLCFLVGGFTIVASSVFQALGKGLLSMSISIFRQLVLVLPLAYLFSLTGELNLVW